MLDYARNIAAAKHRLDQHGYITESMRDDQVLQVAQNFYPGGWEGFCRDLAGKPKIECPELTLEWCQAQNPAVWFAGSDLSGIDLSAIGFGGTGSLGAGVWVATFDRTTPYTVNNGLFDATWLYRNGYLEYLEGSYKAPSVEWAIAQLWECTGVAYEFESESRSYWTLSDATESRRVFKAR